MFYSLFLTLLIGQSETDDLKLIIEQARVRAIIDEAKQNKIVEAVPQRTTYGELRKRAIELNKPLIVLVKHDIVQENENYLYYYCDKFSTVQRTGCVISIPINGELWWIKTIPSYDEKEIDKTFVPRLRQRVPHVNH